MLRSAIILAAFSASLMGTTPAIVNIANSAPVSLNQPLPDCAPNQPPSRDCNNLNNILGDGPDPKPGEPGYRQGAWTTG